MLSSDFIVRLHGWTLYVYYDKSDQVESCYFYGPHGEEGSLRDNAASWALALYMSYTHELLLDLLETSHAGPYGGDQTSVFMKRFMLATTYDARVQLTYIAQRSRDLAVFELLKEITEFLEQASAPLPAVTVEVQSTNQDLDNVVKVNVPAVTVEVQSTAWHRRQSGSRSTVPKASLTTFFTTQDSEPR